MCRWIAYKGEPTYLEELVFKPANSLVAQSLQCQQGAARTNGDGFGIGWYGSRAEPGVFREVLPAWNDLNLQTLTRQIQSELFFAHVRSSTGTETSRLNCHPFSHDRWLFMHNGQIGEYAKCRRRLEALLGDELFDARLGTTDSELFFLLMLQNGLDHDPAEAIRATIRQINGIAASCGCRDPFKLTICLSDGQRLFACRYASEGTAPSLYWQVQDQNVLIASEPFDGTASSWNAVSENCFFAVDDEIVVEPLLDGPAKTSKPCRLLRAKTPHMHIYGT